MAVKKADAKAMSETAKNTVPAAAEKETAVKKAPAKRAAAKRTSAAKKEVKKTSFLQYAGKEVDLDFLYEQVRNHLDERDGQKSGGSEGYQTLRKTGRVCRILCH